MASEQIVAALLKHESQRLETLVKDYSWWDAAIDNLLISFNETWADDNVGKYLAEAYGVSSSYVVGGNNDYVFVAADKEVLKPKNAPLELSSIVPLLALVRETSGERRTHILIDAGRDWWRLARGRREPDHIRGMGTQSGVARYHSSSGTCQVVSRKWWKLVLAPLRAG